MSAPAQARHVQVPPGIEKAPTGIAGLDEITQGGLPRGRPTLICGEAGSGKTLLAMQFLVSGATAYGEPGVFVAFEETEQELARNVASLGFDVPMLMARKKFFIDHVRVDRSEIVETGEYDLEALFVRLAAAIDKVQARRIVLDTLEALFTGFSNTLLLRSELRRLFAWLKQRGVTAVITGEQGTGGMTRHGIEEYVSDCVIMLDQTMVDQVATRHLRIVKYRGSAHGSNRYPFLIDERGFSVVPITSARQGYAVSTERMSTGIAALDRMLGGKGVYRGSTAMVSGTAGTGKTSIAAHFADAACARGENVLYLAFEESPDQIVRNMRSIGLDLGRWQKRGRLRFQCSRPATYGLETHLAVIGKAIDEIEPALVIFDPITDFAPVGTDAEVKAMLTRLVDYLKSRRISALFTSLTASGTPLESTEVGISSLIDTWLLLRNLEVGGERNRALYVLKSRGMAHSNQVREFLLTDRGVDLVDVYVGPEGVLTGAGRRAQEDRERAALDERRSENERRRRALERRRLALEARIAALRAEFDVELQEAERGMSADAVREDEHRNARVALAHEREGLTKVASRRSKRG